MKKFLLVTAAASVLVGCGEDSISAIQKQFVKEGETYTFKELFSNRKICASENWTEYEEEGINGVAYSCQIKIDGLESSYKEKEEKEIKEVAEVEYYAGLNKSHKEKLEAINNDKNIENPEEKIKEENDAYTKAMNELSEPAKKLIEEKANEYREGSIKSITEEIKWEWSELNKTYNVKELKLTFLSASDKQISANICLENIIHAVANNYTTPEKYLSYFMVSTPRCTLK